MSISESSSDAEQELRWQAWQEKSRRVDRLADTRMKTLFSVVGLILLAWILYQVFWAKTASNSDHMQRAIGTTTIQFLSLRISPGPSAL